MALTEQALGVFGGRVLGASEIGSSANAWVPTAYNSEGLIVSAPDLAVGRELGTVLAEVLAGYSCRWDGPTWLGDGAGPMAQQADSAAAAGTPAVETPAVETPAGETPAVETPAVETPATETPATAGTLATGVRIVPGDIRGSGLSAPDPWTIVEELRTRLGPDAVAAVGLNHLMTSAEHRGGNPLAIGHGRVGLDGYGVTGSYGHGPAALTLAPGPSSQGGRRPRVVVLDTGIGDHPWFTADPAATTITFADGEVAGPDVASSPQRAAGIHDDAAALDPLTGSLPTHTGHGTFIAGLLRQSCPAADIVALTVMQADGIVPEHKLIRALDVVRRRQREAAGWADAIVLSLGYYAETGEDFRYTSGLKNILLDLGRLGVAVFAAAGNDATSRPSYPAAFAIDPDFGGADCLPVTSVAALMPDGSGLAPFSNDGPWVTAEAPGVSLVSTSPRLPDAAAQSALGFVGPGNRWRSALDPDDYREFAVWSGTSFAAPVLAARYLQSLIDDGFPADLRRRRELLPVGRRSREREPTAVAGLARWPAAAP